MLCANHKSILAFLFVDSDVLKSAPKMYLVMWRTNVPYLLAYAAIDF